MTADLWWLVGGGLISVLVGLSWRRGAPKNEAEEHPLRRRLLDLIRRRPGTRLADLWQRLDANRGTAKYHLLMLERAKVVDAVRTKRLTRYFPAEMEAEDRRLVGLLLRGRVLEVIRTVCRNPGISQRELTTSLGISRKVFRRYADLLVDTRLLDEVREPHARRYFATPRLRETLRNLPDEELDEKTENRADAPGGADRP